MADTTAETKAKPRLSELPTWGVVFGVYSLWLGVTCFWSALPFWVILPVAAYAIAWHNSLQHEAIHGHPTKSPFWNAVIAGAPLNFWVPYGIYRYTHLIHHNNENLTDPLRDTEAYYVTPEDWEKMGTLHRKFRIFYNTFPGRMITGPAYAMYSFLSSEIRMLWRGDTRHLGHWVTHLATCLPVALWLVYNQIPFWQYFVLAIYPGHSLSMLRSFIEHRDAEDPAARTCVVESNKFFSLLFLYNNVHSVHHEKPSMPWYEIPKAFKEDREGILERNGGYYFKGYGDVLRAFWRKPWGHPVKGREV